MVSLELPVAQLESDGVHAAIIALDDPFGNLITNVSREEFQKLGYVLGDAIALKIGAQSVTVPYVKTFSDVEIGKPLLYIDSRGRAGLAVNQGNFSEVYRIGPPATLFIPIKANKPEAKGKGNLP